MNPLDVVARQHVVVGEGGGARHLGLPDQTNGPRLFLARWLALGDRGVDVARGLLAALVDPLVGVAQPAEVLGATLALQEAVALHLGLGIEQLRQFVHLAPGGGGDRLDLLLG